MVKEEPNFINTYKKLNKEKEDERDINNQSQKQLTKSKSNNHLSYQGTRKVGKSLTETIQHHKKSIRVNFFNSNIHGVGLKVMTCNTAILYGIHLYDRSAYLYCLFCLSKF